jgi:hypothetical protein
MEFVDWTLIAEGTHSLIYRVSIANYDFSVPYLCVKLFRPRRLLPFNLEKTAYESFLKAQIPSEYIPQIRGYGRRTLETWGLPASSGDGDTYYGLLMEWLEGAERISAKNITLTAACMLLNGLRRIHDAGIYHNDTFARNLVIIPEHEQGVWLDFSCARTGHEQYMREEMQNANALVLEYVFSVHL